MNTESIRYRQRVTGMAVIPNIVSVANEEKSQQYIAQIAALSCEVTLDAIKKGIWNHIINNRKRPKTLYEYNQERVRDFRVSRSKGTADDAAAAWGNRSFEAVVEDLEKYGKATYFHLQTDPIPFVRNYDYSAFEFTLKMLNPKHPHFHQIDEVDISNLLIGDDKFRDLCDGIAKSSIRKLNVSGNKLSDESMKQLSAVLRSMHLLEDLNISKNSLTDVSMQQLFQEKSYSPTLKALNASNNVLNSMSAFCIGMMFRTERVSQLETLVLGGKVGHKGWGDEFLRVIMSNIMEFGANKLKHITFSNGNLTDAGLNCITALLCCDNTALEYINISKNEFSQHMSKTNFINAMRTNKSVLDIFVRECGFKEIELFHIQTAVQRNNCIAGREELSRAISGSGYAQYKRSLGWHELSLLSNCVASTFNSCKQSNHNIKISFIKDNPWRVPRPPAWQTIKTTTGDGKGGQQQQLQQSDILSNVNVIFCNTPVILPPHVKAFLELINQDMRYTDLLQEAGILCKLMTVDPKSAKGKSATSANAKTIQHTIESLEKEVLQREYRHELFLTMRTSAVSDLLLEFQQFRDDSESVLRVAKRLERKHIQQIILDVSRRMNTDKLMFAMEDLRASIVAECEASEQMIGALHKQKLLYLALLQESTSKFQEKFDFTSAIRKSIPYFGNLDAAASFMHYFYLTFPNERKDNKKIEEKMLQQLEKMNNNINISTNNNSNSNDSDNNIDIQSEQEDNVHDRKKISSSATGKRKKSSLSSSRNSSRRSNVMGHMTKRSSLVGTVAGLSGPPATISAAYSLPDEDETKRKREEEAAQAELARQFLNSEDLAYASMNTEVDKQ